MRFYLSVILFFICLNLSATHIVGGEITYRYLNNNTYEINLIVFRDCYNGGPQFDNPAKINIFNSNSILISSLTPILFNRDTLIKTINNPCLGVPPNICYESAQYSDTVVLPPIIGGYYLSYQVCCRNITIVNLNNPTGYGATFMEHIPGSETNAWGNSSPKFSSLPPTFFCVNNPITYNHDALDIDGDSLVYEYGTAYSGCQSFICPSAPIILGLTSINYTPCSYQSQYSSTSPFGVNSNVQINPTSGIISGVPNLLGQFVVVVQAKEYRNGQLIGLHRRDYQFNVAPCLKTVYSNIINASTYCSNKVDFQIISSSNITNSIKYKWDFNDTLSGINNVSEVKNPSHVFSDTGSYLIKLITYDSLNLTCQDTLLKTMRIRQKLEVNFLNSPPLCKNMNVNFNPTYSLNFPNQNYTHIWNFGNLLSGINNNSLLSNPNHKFTDTGGYQVRLIVNILNTFGCIDTIIKIIEVKDYVKSNFTLPTTVCKNQNVVITNTSTSSNLSNPIIYNWTFNNANLSTSALENPSLKYSNAGLYNVKLLVKHPTILGCSDSTVKQIKIDQLTIQSLVPTNLCNQYTVPFITILDTMKTIRYHWDFGDSLITTDTSTKINPSYTYSRAGRFKYTLIGIDSANNYCTDTLRASVTILDVIADFSSPPALCKNSPTNLFANSPSNPNISNYNYTWNFGNPTSGLNNFSYLSSPIHRFTDTGSYNVTLITNVPSLNNCSDTITKTINVKEYVKSDFNIPNLICKNELIQLVNNSNSSNLINPIIYNWTFNNANLNSSTIVSPSVKFNSIGLFDIKLIAINPDLLSCKDSVTKKVKIDQLSIQSVVPTNICNQLTIPFLAQGDPGKVIRYKWDFGDSLLTTDSSTKINPSYTYSRVGNFNYNLIGVDSANENCSDTINASLNILDVILPSFNSEIPPCSNFPVKLKATSSHLGDGGLNNYWQISQSIFIGDSLNYPFMDSGIYNIIITSTSSLHPSCSSTISKTIKTNPKLIATIILDNVYCSSTSIKTNNLSKGSLYPYYTWLLNSSPVNNILNQREPIISFTNLGNNNIKLIYSDSVHPECAVTTSQTVFIHALPEINVLSKQDKCNGGEIAFEANIKNTTGLSETISWEFSDGTFDNGPKIKHVFPFNGNYTNYAIISIPQIKYCSDTSEIVTLDVNNRGELFIPNAFSPNNDNNNDYFKIEGPIYDVFEMRIFNRFGEEIFNSTNQLFGWDGKVKNEAAEAGVYAYYVKVKCPNGNIENKKGNITLIR
jgi:gliding motility-associated-like protein